MNAPKVCPFCGSSDTVREADFGTSLMVNRQHCRHCNSFFEAVKWGDSGTLDLPPFLDEGSGKSFDRE